MQLFSIFEREFFGKKLTKQHSLDEKLHKKSCFALDLCYILYMKEHNIRLQKHGAARDWLRNYLMNLAPGSRLPGLREMIALSGVGRSILEKALLDAERDYLLVRRERSGFYRSYPPSDKVDVVIAVDNSN